MTADRPVPLADIHRGMTFSLRKPFDPADVHAKVCGVSRAGRWNGCDWVWFTRGPNATERGTQYVEKTQAKHVFPVGDAEYQLWWANVRRYRSKVQALRPTGPVESPEVRLARRDLARADALLAATIRVYSTWQGMSDPPVEDSGQFGLFEAGDAA